MEAVSVVACNHQPSSGSQHSRHLRERRLWVFQPHDETQCHYNIEGTIRKGKGVDICLAQFDPLHGAGCGRVGSGKREHSRRRIGASNVVAEPVQPDGCLACATADV